ncbi:ribose-5-phosphate isomerase [Bryocella elongata]|uniref:Ribose-5-phosphate isomerase A n=1 Tax=Bryocella elongata TaxID=863522 RepID=A0A1H6AJP0_9BACT|nr:ribose-5-phosphate isomerase RpiA [Bryocella elongata]SEG47966.1 ribose-5-phosphate isomerase [Bryocella elongata]
MTQDEAKALVGKRAAEMVESGMRVGLGTGSTSVAFIKALGARVQAEGLKIRCVASSDSSTELGRSLGMDVVTLEELPELDLYIDGADEVAISPNGEFYLIKGGGAALLREKIVASAAEKFICVVDQSKMVPKLGKFPLPVEIIKMARPLVERRLADLGLNPVLRRKKDDSGPVLTDEQNYLLDCHCGVIEDPEETAAEIRSIVGVVEHGLFLGMASKVLIAGENGVEEREA